MKQQDAKQSTAQQPASGKTSGLKVRSGVRSGAWSCTSCQGEVMGDQLFRPTCSFCQAT